MKKLIALTLLLVLVCSVAAPSLAYTTTSSVSGSNLYTLDIYLVEYSGTDTLSMFLSQAPSDRGYAHNEVVAAIGSVTVAAYADVYGDGYNLLKFSGSNITLNVTENRGGLLMNTMPTESNWQSNAWVLNASTNQITHAIGPASVNNGVVVNSFPVSNASRTYRFLVFGKVLGDGATLSISLSNGSAFINTATPFFVAAVNGTNGRSSQYLTVNNEYLVTKLTFQGNTEYWISALGGNYVAGNNMRNYPDRLMFRIGIGSSNKTTYLYMYPSGESGAEYRVYPDGSRQSVMFMLTANPTASIKLNEMIYSNHNAFYGLNAFYMAHFENGMGLTALNEGNVMNDRDWTYIAGASDLTEYVSIQPWTPYVQVPEITIVNPPKTGDASMLGFVLMALAAVAAVAVRKVRA